MADRPIAITPSEEDKNISWTRGTQVLQASVENSIKSISPWKKKDSPVEPRRKIRYVTLGLFLLHTQILYTTLSLSLSLSFSLSLSQFEETKEQKRRKTFMSMDSSIHYIYLTLWKCISLYSKGFMYFYVTTWSKLFFAVLLRIFCVTFPFQLLFALCYLA